MESTAYVRSPIARPICLLLPTTSSYLCPAPGPREEVQGGGWRQHDRAFFLALEEVQGHARRCRANQLCQEATELGWKAKELKKAAEALHQEKRSGNNGRKWHKNESLLLENDLNTLEEINPQGEKDEATWAFTVLA